MRAGLLAFAAAALGVLATWEALGAATAIATRAIALIAPLRADREPADAERRRLTAVGSLAALAAGWMLAGASLALVLAFATPLAVRQALSVQARRRQARLIEAAPAVARAIADALAAGGSIRAAVATASRGGVAISTLPVLERLANAIELGEETECSLERLRAAANHRCYDSIVAAILLQREAGGDLVGLLRQLAATLEQDAREVADARAATAQARYSAGLVAGLPLVAAVLAELAAPGSVRLLLSTPLSAVLTAAAVSLQLLAWVVIRRVSAPPS